jgi:hypothetical protein
VNRDIIKAYAFGALGGAVALGAIGFFWAGWRTGDQARIMAETRSHAAVIAALTPLCLERSQTDPDSGAKLAALKAAAPYDRLGLAVQSGWTSMPGASEPNRDLAAACAEKLGS